MKNITFIDIETGRNGAITDTGTLKTGGAELHTNSLTRFARFIKESEYIAGHNILSHDKKYLEKEIAESGAKHFIDTLYWSPLLFPKKPYHKLVKDYKLTGAELNNPLSDAKNARDLFLDECAAFNNLDEELRQIYYSLLGGISEFKDFFKYIEYEKKQNDISAFIRKYFAGQICENAPLEKLSAETPVELSYVLAITSAIKSDSITPPWVLKNYPRVEDITRQLLNKRCKENCLYCEEFLNERKALKTFFGFDDFRLYGGEPLQRRAVRSALAGKSILAVFPTGGGKSITFQLPALMAGANEKGLTVVISPLQSLMKDQTDNLERQHNITDAVTINGSLDPIERAKAL